MDLFEKNVFQPIPPGYRFEPTYVELIDYYLSARLFYGVLPNGFNKLFLDVDLYNHNPQDLIRMHEELEEDQNSWYFFTPRERKYGNGRRPKRSAGNGYWKAVGKDTQIIHNGVVIGYKRVLDFLTGKYPKGERTEWKMHEYLTKDQKDQLHNLPSTSAKLNDCVLCKIYKNKRVVNKRKRDGDQDVEEYESDDHDQNIAESESIVLPTNQDDQENDDKSFQNLLTQFENDDFDYNIDSVDDEDLALDKWLNILNGTEHSQQNGTVSASIPPRPFGNGTIPPPDPMAAPQNVYQPMQMQYGTSWQGQQPPQPDGIPLPQMPSPPPAGMVAPPVWRPPPPPQPLGGGHPHSMQHMSMQPSHQQMHIPPPPPPQQFIVSKYGCN
ncbi:hypothetical protein DH2020_001267 [Rehmannia glutinosa]|uniref:NAC domain-containing protein n=1 Tax=Rehmannia glutinosa TaxID=99300 RepID=A0ABR0XYY3_REHGL